MLSSGSRYLREGFTTRPPSTIDWPRAGLSTTKEEPSIIVYRFTRVVFGVSSSPFLLNATDRHHLESQSEKHGDLVSKILRSIYVDDVVTSTPSEEAAYEVYNDAKALLKVAAFNLRKFSTNSQALQSRIDRELYKTTETHNKELGAAKESLHDGEQRVLGVNWNINADQIVFVLDEVAEESKRLEPTKRNVIHLIGKFYDPIGYLAPIVIRCKVFMHSLCELKVG